MRIELTKERKILIICILISWVLLLFGILSGIQGVIGNIIFLSILIIIVPQLLFSYVNYRRMKEIELYYPNFLRDLVEATKAGLPLHKAIISVSRTNYGPLTKEIKKMANQLSWNVNVIKVLEQSQKRLKKSPILTKIIRIMIETYKSGGSIPDTLSSLSNTLSTIQETEKERASLMKQYVIAVYVISFVFIGIIVAINKLMVPIFETMSGGFAGGPIGTEVANPCTICIYGGGLECLPCTIYFNICSLFGVERIRVSCYYFGLFFCMSVVQAITGGLIAGQIGEGSVKAGIKHSVILFFITFGAFFILRHVGLIGV
ncbi:MAG: hypothetical protein DRP62_06120 [Planctomycetota bacterium]|nr:MAG: hypothetical protein DRP62_06120 [Planctomycetota bacterium]